MTTIKNGRFVATPKGVKTPKMLEVEKRLGRSLEEDFEEYYIQKHWGQKKLANRWGVQRNLIFTNSMREGRRSWSKMLGLNVRRNDTEPVVLKQSTRACELCKTSDMSLDSAHWVSHKDGGSLRTYNILELCPNCHRKLDRNEPVTISRCREILLFRECRRILENGRDSEAKQKQFTQVAEAIILRKPL